MLQKSKTYVYGNTAKKIEYNVYEENRVLKEKKRYKSQRKVRLKAIGVILLLFVACMTVMYRYALITELNYSYSKMEEQYNELRRKNSILEVDIEKQTDLSKIREIAEERLNMQKPDRSQMVFVRVPKTDYTIVAEPYKSIDRTKTDKNMFAILLDKVSKFAKMLY